MRAWWRASMPSLAPSTAVATRCCRRRRRPTPASRSSGSRPSASAAGTAASTPTASRGHGARASRTDACACSMPGGSRARRAPTCSPTPSWLRAPATRGSSSCWAGGGSEEDALRARRGASGQVLGWREGEELARAYSDADHFLFCSRTDTFGQVVLEAQAAGLPVVAVAAGGPAELIADGRSGLLCPPRAEALGGAVAGLAGSRAMRERLARGGLAAVQERTWEAALRRLAAGWQLALVPEAARTQAVA